MRRSRKKPPPTPGEITRKKNKLINLVEPFLLVLGFSVYAEEEDFVCYLYRPDDIPGITMLDAYADGTWDYYDVSMRHTRTRIKNEPELRTYLAPTLIGAKLFARKMDLLLQVISE